MLIPAIKAGLKRSWNIPLIIGIFLLINFLTGFLFSKPLYSTFQDFFSGSLVTNILAKSNFQTYYSEYFRNMHEAIKVGKSVLNLGGFLFLLVTVVLSGGLIHQMLFQENRQIRNFSRQCGYFAGRMLKIALISAFILLIVFVTVPVIIKLFYDLVPDPSGEDRYFLFVVFGAIIAGMFVLWFLLWIDLTRTVIVRSDLTSVFQAFKTALMQLAQTPFRFYFGYLLISLTGILLLFLYLILQNFIPDTGMPGIIINFFLLQIFIYFSYWIKFARFGVLDYLVFHPNEVNVKEESYLS